MNERKLVLIEFYPKTDGSLLQKRETMSKEFWRCTMNLTEAEKTEALRESKQLARECLDKGLPRLAIAAMFNLLVLGGMSMDDCKQQTDRVLDSIGDDPEKVRRFIESWDIKGYH